MDIYIYTRLYKTGDDFCLDFSLTKESNSLIEGILSNDLFRACMIHRKYLDTYCSRDRLWKFVFSLCFRELVVFPFQNNHQRTTLQSFMVFFFFDKFLSFKSFPYFSIVKKTKERGCCNPVEGGIKEFFSNFTYKEIKSFAQNELPLRLLPFFGIKILNRGNFKFSLNSFAPF